MHKFNIHWDLSGAVEIEAENPEEALKKFKEIPEKEKMEGAFESPRVQFVSSDTFCVTHNKPHEKIEDRSEHFEHEKADPVGCPACYVLQKEMF